MASGTFTGDVVALWLHDDPEDPGGDDRMMILTQGFDFTDPRGKIWTAPVGTRTDGASIPSFAWSWISPFIGDYRRAAVIHDRYCTRGYRTEPWKDTHRMFHEAMLADGTGKIKALIMYAAVYAFGPRWPNPATRQMQLSATEQARLLGMLEAAPADTDAVWTQISERDFAGIVSRIEDGELDIDQVEEAVDAAPAARVIAEAAPAPVMMEGATEQAAARVSSKSVKIKLVPPAPPAAKSGKPDKANGKKDRGKDKKKKGDKKKR